jgi:hypothetical protein
MFPKNGHLLEPVWNITPFYFFCNAKRGVLLFEEEKNRKNLKFVIPRVEKSSQSI